MGDSRIKAAGEVLTAFFDEEKLKRGGRYAEFFASWKYLVGEQLAAHSHVADVNNGVLFVEAEHPGWIQLLQLRQSSILSGVAARFPEFGLRAIAFRLGSPRPPLRSSRKEPPDPPSSDDSGRGDEAPTRASGPEAAADLRKATKSLDEIADPSLKAILGSLKKTLDGNGK